jgi:peptide/nickel transport system ATP-binding protein
MEGSQPAGTPNQPVGTPTGIRNQPAGTGTEGGNGKEILRVEHLVVEYGPRRRRVHAVSDVSFLMAEGETLGLVGESGSGKSTTGRAIAHVQPPTSGHVYFDGIDLGGLSTGRLRRARTQIQMVFQDPISSLNPRRRVRDIVAEPLAIWNTGTAAQRAQRAAAMLEAVGIDPVTVGQRRPQQLSGGQCQRVSIARALMLEPRLLVCDEPVSALDVSVQAQILNLLADLKEQHGFTMLFIAHDLAVVKSISDRVAVMYLGKLCELAPADTLYDAPLHPYTAALISSVPSPDPERGPRTPLAGRTAGMAGTGPVAAALANEVPSPLHPPSGCRFRTRCAYAATLCAREEPPMRQLAPDHFVACHFPLAH